MSNKSRRRSDSPTGEPGPKKAAALGYDQDRDEAPRLLAKGAGALAQKIIKIAKEHDIPIREDPDLVEALMQLDLDEAIPPELYRVVAEILAFIYNLNMRCKDNKLLNDLRDHKARAG